MATAMAGHLLVPIDAGHPSQRQAAIFQESGAVGLILEEGGKVDDGIAPAGLPRITIDPREPSHAPELQVRCDSDAPLSSLLPQAAPDAWRRPTFIFGASGSDLLKVTTAGLPAARFAGFS